ncbi:site-2 protease family protein [Saprospiraceae bacterium]|nr:site-2 protease family protein [Saprospiraceae bacterium]
MTIGKKIEKILNANIPLGNFFGIPFKLHWTIIPFFIFIPFLGYYYDMSVTQSFLLLALVILILISVLLHELGHATAARSEGIKTHDIIISLIGGAARLEQMPEEPKKEIKIAIAGPLVNLVIFVLTAIPIGLIAYFSEFRLDLSFRDLSKPGVFISLLALSNLMLFLFNLVPAFPMDGGRIFRAQLAKKMPRQKATAIASVVGKILASLMIIFGIFYLQPVFSLIGIFIFLMAEVENNHEKNNIKFRNVTALDICDREYHTVKIASTMQELINIHFDEDVELFIVMAPGNKVRGIVDKYRLDDAMREKNPEYAVSYYINHRYAIVNVSHNLLHVYEELITKDMPVALVMDYGELVGIIDKEILQSAMNFKVE